MIANSNQINPDGSGNCPYTVSELTSISGFIVSRMIAQLEYGRLHIVSSVSDFRREALYGFTLFEAFDLLRFEIAPLTGR